MRALTFILALISMAWTQTPTHLIVAVDGQATLKRSHWQIENPLTFGTEVVVGDLIHLLGESAQVKVLCADLSLETLSGREFSSVGCSGEAPQLYYEGERLSRLRTSPQLNLPRVLSPRATELLTNRPTFVWQAVPNASYTARLKALPDDVVWEVQTEMNTLAYPDKPALKPGVSYVLEVAARVGDATYSSDDEELPNLGFSLLDDAKARAVREQEKIIRALPLSEEARAFALAHLYASNGLYAEAILQLESINGTKESVDYLMGKLHETIRLPLHAERYYRQSLQMAHESRDLQRQALSSLALGRLFDIQYNNVAQGAEFYENARENYKTLGDAARAESIERVLLEIRSQE